LFSSLSLAQARMTRLGVRTSFAWVRPFSLSESHNSRVFNFCELWM